MSGKPIKINRFFRLMAAVTFAEANEHVTARKILQKEVFDRPQKRTSQNARKSKGQRPVLMA